MQSAADWISRFPGSFSVHVAVDGRVKNCQEEIYVLLGDAHGGLDAKGLSVYSSFPYQDSHVFYVLKDLPHCLRRQWVFAGLVFDHFHADLQAFSTDITNNLILVSEFCQFCHQIGAHIKTVLLCAVFLDSLKH